MLTITKQCHYLIISCLFTIFHREMLQRVVVVDLLLGILKMFFFSILKLVAYYRDFFLFESYQLFHVLAALQKCCKKNSDGEEEEEEDEAYQ